MFIISLLKYLHLQNIFPVYTKTWMNLKRTLIFPKKTRNVLCCLLWCIKAQIWQIIVPVLNKHTLHANKSTLSTFEPLTVVVNQ